MRIFSYHNLLTSAVVFSLFATTSGYGVMDDAIQRSAAMNLVFVKIYEVQILTFKAPKVEESQLSEFLDTWGDVLGEDYAKNMYQRMEPHLAYFIGQASLNENDFTAVVVALGIKTMALLQGINYLSCVMYYKRLYGGSPPKHCQNLAAHLLIFSNLNIKKLTEKLFLLSESAENLNFYEFSKYSDNITLFSRDFIKPFVRSPSKRQIHISELSFGRRDRLYNDIDREISFRENLEDLSLRIVCGNFGNLSVKYRFHPGIDHELNFWKNSISINENLIHNYSGNPQQVLNAISNVLRATAIVRSDLRKTYRRSYVVRFERMLTNIGEFKIFPDGYKYINNLQLEDDRRSIPVVY